MQGPKFRGWALREPGTSPCLCFSRRFVCVRLKRFLGLSIPLMGGLGDPSPHIGKEIVWQLSLYCIVVLPSPTFFFLQQHSFFQRSFEYGLHSLLFYDCGSTLLPSCWHLGRPLRSRRARCVSSSVLPDCLASPLRSSDANFTAM